MKALHVVPPHLAETNSSGLIFLHKTGVPSLLMAADVEQNSAGELSEGVSRLCLQGEVSFFWSCLF